MPTNFTDELLNAVARGKLSDYQQALFVAAETTPWWSVFRKAELKRQLQIVVLARRIYIVAYSQGRDAAPLQ